MLQQAAGKPSNTWKGFVHVSLEVTVIPVSFRDASHSIETLWLCFGSEGVDMNGHCFNIQPNRQHNVLDYASCKLTLVYISHQQLLVVKRL